jgi:hypothetical protein
MIVKRFDMFFRTLDAPGHPITNRLRGLPYQQSRILQ